MGDGAIRHAQPHPPTERSSKCGGCRLQHELDALRSAVRSGKNALAYTVTNVPAEGRPHWCRRTDGTHDATCLGMLHTQDEMRAASGE